MKRSKKAGSRGHIERHRLPAQKIAVSFIGFDHSLSVVEKEAIIKLMKFENTLPAPIQADNFTIGLNVVPEIEVREFVVHPSDRIEKLLEALARTQKANSAKKKKSIVPAKNSKSMTQKQVELNSFRARERTK